ncbi:MAG: TetR/AcrR family transcriptional regulator [Candidatus Limnocylindrales bacterium]
MVETRRQQIETIASSLFREQGYAGTSVRDIARGLDIQGASLYAHVASKEDVLWAIVRRAAERFEAEADMAERATAGAAHVERLEAYVRGHVGVLTENVGQASVFIREWRSLSADRRARIGARRDAYEGRWRQLIAEGSQAGAFAPADPPLAAAYLLTALNGIVTWYRPDGPLSARAITAEFVNLSLRSLGAEERP